MKYLRIALAAACSATLATVLSVTSAGAATPQQAPRTTPTVAEASLIQGLPQTSVDVYLNGTEIVQDFRFKGVIGPLPLVPGKYHLALRLHGQPRSVKPFLSGGGMLKAGQNLTIVADLTSAGVPALTKFWNPNPTLPKGRGAELIVRNVADDPGFNVFVDGLRIVRDLQNPHGGSIRLPAEWVKVSMRNVVTHTLAIGPVGVHLRAQTVTVVYAIGNPATSTLTTVEQSYSTS
jgi:hypothetical protein